jgi:hypothetical protein
MSMLTPLFALAALAVLGPILLHLVRRKPKETLSFSSLMFLEDSPPKWTQQSRIEQWLLLALRSLVIALLALAFTRPYWASAAKLTGSNEIGLKRIVLMDQSASMRRAGIWDAANARVSDVLANANPADVVAVYSFDQQLHPRLSLSAAVETAIGNRKSAAGTAVRTISPGWGEGDLGKAINECVDLLQREQSDVDSGAIGDCEIVVVSDFVAGTPVETLSEKEWPARISLRLERVSPIQSGNAFFEMRADEESENAGKWRVRVTNEPGSLRERFRLNWLGENGNRLEPIALECTVPAGQSMVYPLPAPDAAVRGMQLTGDDCVFDNRRFVVPASGRTLRVLCLEDADGGPESTLRHFLERVPVGSAEDSVVFLRVKSGEEWGVSAMPRDTWIVCAETISERDADRMHEFMKSGGHVLWVLDQPLKEIGRGEERVLSTTDEAKPSLSETGSSPGAVLQDIASRFEKLSECRLDVCTEAQVDQYSLLGRIDFKHPVFAPLVDSKFNDFSKVRYWRHRILKLAEVDGWVIPAWFDSGSPAFLQRRIGDGELTILTAGWQPAESQFALSSKFVPIISQLFSLATTRETISTDWVAGRNYPLPGGSSVKRRKFSSSMGDDEERSDKRFDNPSTGSDGGDFWTASPGVLELVDSDGASREVAINIASSESRTALMDYEEVSRYGASVREKPQTREEQVHAERLLMATELESRQSLWWWLLAIVVVIAGCESLLCIRKQGRTAEAVSA